MIEDLHNNNEPVIPAHEGWQQMQGLLNEYLPLRKNVPARQRIMQYAATILFFSILLFTSLQLDTNILHNTNSSHINVATLHTGNRIELRDSFGASTQQQQKNSTPIFLNNQTNRSDQSTPFASARVSAQVAGREYNKRIKGIIEKFAGQKETAAYINSDSHRTAFLENNNNVKKNYNPSWTLYAGIGINANTGAGQNFQPYPVAEARFNMNDRFYVAAGLSAWSPISGSTTGVSKTVYVNDTINNINLYSEKTTYDHLRYADLPVSAGVNMGNHFSLQAGVQLSVLVYKRTKKVIKPYDYQPNSTAFPNFPPAVTTAANGQKDYPVALRNIDMRLVAGLCYTIRKTTLHLNYQHSLQSVGKGNISGNNTNHVVSINVLFRIK